MDPLFTPARLGALSLKHRVVMAPLTRMRSLQPGDIPHKLNAEYYGQRASDGGLIITEATDISPSAAGYAGAPGIHTAEQVAGWRLVTDIVHAKGGLIVNQIWHTGRFSHSSLQPDGKPPFAPSAIAIKGEHKTRQGELVPYETPRVLTEDQIAGIVRDFARAAANSKAAGFDGVEIHGANGYLIDQFLRNGSNRRTDRYGGPIENRARFLLEAVDAVIPVWGRDRVGVRLSPFGRDGDMIDSDGFALWRHAARELGERGLAYLHLVEPRADKSSDVNAIHPDAPDAAAELKDVFGGPLISAGGYVGETARAAILSGKADAVAFGRLFIANPDLAKRLRVNAPTNRHHRPSFYGGSEVGYTDYPFLKDIQVPLQTSAEFARTYNAQAHEIVDAITAAVTSAQAGLNWLRAEPPDLEEVRQMLNFIASDGKRAAEIVIRLQALIEKVPTADAAL
jgi:N-ethylmaleimide reductase